MGTNRGAREDTKGIEAFRDVCRTQGTTIMPGTLPTAHRLRHLEGHPTEQFRTNRAPTGPGASVSDPHCIFSRGGLVRRRDLLIQGAKGGGGCRKGTSPIRAALTVRDIKGTVKSPYIRCNTLHHPLGRHVDGGTDGGRNRCREKETAKVVGNIFAPTVRILEGAGVQGRIEHGRQKGNRAGRPSRFP